MCDISLFEQHLEARIAEMLTETAFKPYMNCLANSVLGYECDRVS
ncbi:hypothetical protein [Nostoc sp. ChiQUE01b]|nr:hypothetical protein [Nostoc sp. ChiQUE01b]MDZ8261108.1 hypothetical protein [Nostoc sp. ChiQUE01b]MDZ8261718.1 hypothetical protein [Nostoc sp. ChiQUE01b]